MNEGKVTLPEKKGGAKRGRRMGSKDTKPRQKRIKAGQQTGELKKSEKGKKKPIQLESDPEDAHHSLGDEEPVIEDENDDVRNRILERQVLFPIC